MLIVCAPRAVSHVASEAGGAASAARTMTPPPRRQGRARPLHHRLPWMTDGSFVSSSDRWMSPAGCTLMPPGRWAGSNSTSTPSRWPSLPQRGRPSLRRQRPPTPWPASFVRVPSILMSFLTSTASDHRVVLLPALEEQP